MRSLVRDHPLLASTHGLPPVPYYRAPLLSAYSGEQFGYQRPPRYLEPPALNRAVDHSLWQLQPHEIDNDLAIFADFDEAPPPAQPYSNLQQIPPYSGIPSNNSYNNYTAPGGSMAAFRSPLPPVSSIQQPMHSHGKPNMMQDDPANRLGYYPPNPNQDLNARNYNGPGRSFPGPSNQNLSSLNGPPQSKFNHANSYPSLAPPGWGKLDPNPALVPLNRMHPSGPSNNMIPQSIPSWSGRDGQGNPATHKGDALPSMQSQPGWARSDQVKPLMHDRPPYPYNSTGGPPGGPSGLPLQPPSSNAIQKIPAWGGGGDWGRI